METPAAIPRLPVADPPLDRAAILLAVAQAASSAALNANDAEQQRRLDGKRFELRIRFGCPAGREAATGSRFSIAFDEAERTLRIRAAPDLALDDARIAPLAGEAIEAAEGFWLRRPWLLAAQCPLAAPTPDQPDATAPAETKLAAPAAPAPGDPAEARPGTAPNVGIAQFYTNTDARTGRRDRRAYETTQVLGEDERPSPEGYNLVLSGRLRPMPGGQVISCRVTSFDVPPDCVVSALFDRVWIERPDTKAILAEWSR